jgi:hypothetical protein
MKMNKPTNVTMLFEILRDHFEEVGKPGIVAHISRASAAFSKHPTASKDLEAMLEDELNFESLTELMDCVFATRG